MSKETEVQLMAETGGGEWGACRARDPVRKREMEGERVWETGRVRARERVRDR